MCGARAYLAGFGVDVSEPEELQERLGVILGLEGGQGGEHDGAVAGTVLLVHLADTWAGQEDTSLRPTDTGRRPQGGGRALRTGSLSVRPGAWLRSPRALGSLSPPSWRCGRVPLLSD